MGNKQVKARGKTVWKPISVSLETKAALDSIKHPGQSYDGLIQELVTFWKEGHQAEGAPQHLSAIVGRRQGE